MEQLVSLTLALLAGGVLWSMGSMVVRVGIALAGMALGALIGWLTWIETGGSFPLWIILLAFAVVVGLVSLVIYRLLLAGLLSLICASFGFVTVWSLLALLPTNADPTPPPPLIDMGMILIGDHDSASDATEHDSTERQDLVPAAKQQANALRRTLVARTSTIWNQWQQLAPRARLSIVGGVLGGLLLGLLLATFAQKTSAVIVTAVAGSVLVMASFSRLLAMMGAPMKQVTEAWVPLPSVVLAALAIAGIIVQLSLLRRRRRNQEPVAAS